MSKASDRDLRAQIALKMLVEDCQWAADVALSMRTLEVENSGLVPLLLTAHWSRIAYEGRAMFQSSNRRLSRPDVVQKMGTKFSSQLARARHSVKLFDDTERGYEGILTDIREFLNAHRQKFVESTPLLVRGLTTDLGLFRLGDQVVGSTVASHSILDKSQRQSSTLR